MSIRGDVKGQYQSTFTYSMNMLLNRDGTDGQILGFRKDGSDIGNIGVSGSNIYFQFGSTGTDAHRLDDYEEGSWSATSLNYDYDSNVAQRGHYIKVGRLVHAFFRVKFHNQSTHVGNQLVFSGLPFTAASGNPYDVNVGGYAQGYASIDFHRIFVSPGTTAAYWYTDIGGQFNNSTSLNGADVRGCRTFTAAS